MPEIPETSKKHRANIPKLPILTHRTSSAHGLIKSDIGLSKESAELKEIISKCPSETKLDYLKISKKIKPSSSTNRMYHSSTGRILASSENPNPVYIRRISSKTPISKVKAMIRNQNRRHTYTSVRSQR